MHTLHYLGRVRLIQCNHFVFNKKLYDFLQNNDLLQYKIFFVNKKNIQQMTKMKLDTFPLRINKLFYLIFKINFFIPQHI